MIKGFINIIVSILLLTTTSGISITRHYCGDQLVKIGVYSEPTPCCERHGCCHNETSFHQLKENFFTPDNTVDLHNTAHEFMFSAVFVVLDYDPVMLVSRMLPFAIGPPGDHAIDNLSLFQSFRC